MQKLIKLIISNDLVFEQTWQEQHLVPFWNFSIAAEIIKIFMKIKKTLKLFYLLYFVPAKFWFS